MGLSDVDKIEGYTAKPAAAGQGGKGASMGKGMAAKFSSMGKMGRKATTGMADGVKKPKMGKGAAMGGGIKSPTSKGC